jgi:hypothetical protein
MEAAQDRDTERERAEFLQALRELDAALDANIDRAHRMKQRISELEEACTTGRPIKDIVPLEEPPLIVHLLTESTKALHDYGAGVRRTEARVLHREGMPMDQIAKLFRVTRQRVSVLLRNR